MPRFKTRKADNMDTAAHVLQLAHQTAEQAIADAQREAEEIRARARQEPEQIIADAKGYVPSVFKAGCARGHHRRPGAGRRPLSRWPGDARTRVARPSSLPRSRLQPA